MNQVVGCAALGSDTPWITLQEEHSLLTGTEKFYNGYL